MQNFQNTADGSLWAFEDDVVVTVTAGVYSFATADGFQLTNLPTTLVPYTPPPPSPAVLLAQAQATQQNLILAAYTVARDAGFTSSALGSPYTYASDQGNQTLLQAQAARNVDLHVFCTPVGGTLQYVLHTLAQLDQVETDLETFLSSLETKLSNLLAQVGAATTPTAVQAIVWS